MIFNSSDAWLLESIKLSEQYKGARLTDIISTADYINHAIMTFDEFVSGTNKLMNAGLIKEKEKRLQTTDRFNTWWTKKFENKKRVGLLKTMEEIEKYLNQNYTTLDSTQTKNKSKFTAGDFDKATADYLKLAQGTLDKLTKKGK